jgi:hypothetical protein
MLLVLLARRIESGPLLPGKWSESGAFRRAGLAVLAAWCVARAWASVPFPADFRQGRLPWSRARAAVLTTWGEGMAMAEAAGARRVLLLDDATYPIRARVVFGGGLGETPLPWGWVRESLDGARLAVKFRQANVGFVLHNYVSMEWSAVRNAGFTWSDRMLSLYRGFCGACLVPAGQTAHRDLLHGGFTLFRVGRPGRGGKAPPYFMPGAENVLARTLVLRASGRAGEALKEVRSVEARLPGVGFVLAEEGIILNAAGEWRRTLKVMEPVVRSGFVDGSNLMTVARAAVETGNLALADRMLGRAGEVYPETEVRTRLVQAQVAAKLADRALGRGDRALARRELERAEKIMEGIVAGGDAYAAGVLKRTRLELPAMWKKAGGR